MSRRRRPRCQAPSVAASCRTRPGRPAVVSEAAGRRRYVDWQRCEAVCRAGRSPDDRAAHRVRFRTAGVCRGQYQPSCVLRCVIRRRLSGACRQLHSSANVAGGDATGREHASPERVHVDAGMRRRASEGRSASRGRRSDAKPRHVPAALWRQPRAVPLRGERVLDRRPRSPCDRERRHDGRRRSSDIASGRNLPMVRRHQPVRSLAPCTRRRCHEDMECMRSAAEGGNTVRKAVERPDRVDQFDHRGDRAPVPDLSLQSPSASPLRGMSAAVAEWNALARNGRAAEV